MVDKEYRRFEEVTKVQMKEECYNVLSEMEGQSCLKDSDRMAIGTAKIQDI